MLKGKEALREHLSEMDGLLERLPAWMAGQYDPESGGFYYARSSRLSANRRPDIESTAQALNMLERLGLLEAMPAAVKVNMIHFFKSRQEPESGYFYDHDPCMREDEVMVSRALGYSANALRKLGAAPTHPLPDAAKQAPFYMRSPEAYLKWLQSIDLSNSWRGCDRLCCSHVYVKQLPEPERSAFAQTAFRFFAETQDRDSGLWGEGALYERISGTFKLHTFYSGFQTPMPHTEQLAASILLGLRHEEASDMCYIRNPVHLLSYIRPAMKEEDLRLVLRTTLYNMSRLLRSDGGISRELAHSPSAPNVAQVKNGASYPGMPKPVHLSEGLVEGDMNAATQALLIRSLCYAMADETPPKLVQRADEFYDGMMERRTLFMLHPTIATPMEWARAACDSLMSVYLPEELPPASRWHYHQGVFLCGMEMLWEAERDQRYDAYIKRYVDRLVDDHGNFDFARDELDAIQAGLLLFRLDERNGGSKYRAAADKLRYLFHTLNRTSEGGFWHKDKYAYNMWLDGLYMGGVFALKYAKLYGDTGLRDMALHQERLMRRYMRDERTGLLYHAWDESRRMPWADRETGCSPEFWGRSLGWYGLALAQFLDELPEEHAGRNELASSLADFAEALARYQDAESGLWYQVVDKGYLADNWLETSCTCLFVYTLAKAYKFGLVGEACLNAAKRGYEGLTRVLQFDEKGRFILPDICIGTSAGDYENYVTRPTSQNDLHGVGAFVMASVEMQALLG